MQNSSVWIDFFERLIRPTVRLAIAMKSPCNPQSNVNVKFIHSESNKDPNIPVDQKTPDSTTILRYILASWKGLDCLICRSSIRTLQILIIICIKQEKFKTTEIITGPEKNMILDG